MVSQRVARVLNATERRRNTRSHVKVQETQPSERPKLVEMKCDSPMQVWILQKWNDLGPSGFPSGRVQPDVEERLVLLKGG
jgi:hypothetical protein